MEQINLNLIPGRALPVCHVSQYDVGRTIRCNLFEGDQVFALATGDIAEVHVRKPDTTVVTASLTIVNGQTYLDIVTTQQMDAVAGSNLCEIQLKRSGNTLGTLNFIMEVEPDPMANGVASASEIHDLQAQVNSAVNNSTVVQEMQEEIDNIEKVMETVLFTGSTGSYVSSANGAINSGVNYSTAVDNGNARIRIPKGCYKIIFNNVVFYPSGVQGWATYNKNTGSSTAAFLRGGRTPEIIVQDTDKYFAISSYKSGGQFVTSFSVTFIYNKMELEVEDLDDAINKMKETTTLSTTSSKWVDYRDGVVHDIGTQYSSVLNYEIPAGVTRLNFPGVEFVTSGYAGWAVYDASGTYIRGAQTNYAELQDGDKYFSVTTHGSPAAASIDLQLVYGAINQKIIELESSITNTNNLANEGQKVVMLGDSIVGNYDGAGSIPVYLAEYTKATVYNCAFGGSSMGADLVSPDQYLEAFNGWKILTAITTNDWSEQQDAIDNDPNYDHLKAYFQTHLNTLKNMDWSTVDIITLSYGTNDWGTKVVLDDPNAPKSTDTFTGAYRTALETLWATYPHIKIMACGVIWRGLTITDGQITADSDDGKHGRNWYLREFEEAIETVCSEYHVPFVPMYDYTNFNRYTWSAYFPSTDGTHPNAVGRKVIGKRYAAHLIELTKN